MTESEELENFLKNNRISDEEWKKSECNWDLLQAIKEDYEKNISKFEDAATILVKEIQKISAVHSVRWRIKNTDHLLEKIIRKCADIERQEKYKTISVENYQEVVTDLVGIRALHLFKEDCFEIDKKLKETDYFSSIKETIAYLRQGDSFEKKLTEYGFKVKHHEAGYRSIHYLLPAPLTNCQFMVEIQVRTLFEEGWSEIDHKIRYPNFSDNPLILHFLSIFNQIASNADEIGSFVLWLNNEENARIQNDKKIKVQENIFREQENALSEKIQELENAFQEQENAFQEQEKTIHKLENTISSLQDKNRKEKKNQELMSQLKQDAAKLKTSNSRGILDLVRLNLDEMKKTSSMASQYQELAKNLNGGLLSTARLNFDDINKTSSIANSATNAFNQYKDELTKSSSGLLNLGRQNLDEMYKASAIAEATKSHLPKDLALGLGRQNLDEMYKVSPIVEATKSHLPKNLALDLGQQNLDEMYKASAMAEATKSHLPKDLALGLNNSVLNSLDKFNEDIAKTQKLTGTGMIGGLNNLNFCPKCFLKISSLNKCPVCGF